MAITGILEFDVLLRPVADQDAEPVVAGRLGVIVPLGADSDTIADTLAANVTASLQNVDLQPADPTDN